MGVVTLLLLLLIATPAFGQQKSNAPNKEKLSFKTRQFINSHSVDFDTKGRCKAVDGILMRKWKVKSFPALISHFETCISVTSTTTSGMVNFELVIQDKLGRSISSVEGVMDLGDSGAASQAVDWDHLEIPKAGVYYMRLVLQGKRIGKYKMVFTKAGKPR